MRIAALLITLSLFGLEGYAQVPSTLVGKWVVDFDSTVNRMSATEKSRYNGFQPHVKANVKNVFIGRSFELKDDGSVVVVLFHQAVRKELSGTWSFRSSDATLTMNVSGNTDHYRVVADGPKALQLIFKDPAPNGVFSSLYLTRSSL